MATATVNSSSRRPTGSSPRRTWWMITAPTMPTTPGTGRMPPSRRTLWAEATSAAHLPRRVADSVPEAACVPAQAPPAALAPVPAPAPDPVSASAGTPASDPWAGGGPDSSAGSGVPFVGAGRSRPPYRRGVGTGAAGSGARPDPAGGFRSRGSARALYRREQHYQLSPPPREPHRHAGSASAGTKGLIR